VPADDVTDTTTTRVGIKNGMKTIVILPFRVQTMDHTWKAPFSFANSGRRTAHLSQLPQWMLQAHHHFNSLPFIPYPLDFCFLGIPFGFHFACPGYYPNS
jgi:hypothetical protein